MDSWFAWGSRVNCYRPQLFISVSDGGLSQPGLRMSRWANNFYDSGILRPCRITRGLGADDICSASTGTVSVVINVQKLRAARSSQAAATQVAGDWGGATAISRDSGSAARPGSLGLRWLECDSILSHTTLASLLSVLSPCGAAGEVCNILSQSTFNRQINLSTLGPPYLATMKVWRNDSTLYWWRRKCGFSCHPFLKAATFFCRL